MTDQRADVAGWITPPADGGERLDGRSAALITADRVLTGRRGRAEGGLEVLGGADDAAREAGRGGAVLLRGATSWRWGPRRSSRGA